MSDRLKSFQYNTQNSRIDLSVTKFRAFNVILQELLTTTLSASKQITKEKRKQSSMQKKREIEKGGNKPCFTM